MFPPTVSDGNFCASNTIYSDNLAPYTSRGAVNFSTEFVQLMEGAAPTQSGTNSLLLYDDSTSHLLSAKVGNNTSEISGSRKNDRDEYNSLF